MPEITNLTATTELQAVNAALAAAGESPVTSLDTDHPDVEMALEALRNTVRELQTRPYDFNTEYDLQLAPDQEDFAWTDVDGTAVTLNIWEVPAGLAQWNLSAVPDQIGSDHLDLIPRPSKQYTDGEGDAVLVFYDRDYNRDGLPADERDYIWIDAVWYFDFEQLPELARRLCTVRAARRFVTSSVGSQTLVSLGESDENEAFRNFLREHSQPDTRNVFNHPERARFLGRPKLRYAQGWRKNRRW